MCRQSGSGSGSKCSCMCRQWQLQRQQHTQQRSRTTQPQQRQQVQQCVWTTAALADLQPNLFYALHQRRHLLWVCYQGKERR